MEIYLEEVTPLDVGEDEAAAKAVEAGVYAAELIGRHGPSRELARVVEAGRHAEARMWALGLRIAHQQSLTVARTYNVPYDDLLQDCSLAVAEAIRRFDFRRGVRFTTFVFSQIRWALANGTTHRMGAAVTRQDRTAAREVARVQDRLAGEGRAVGLERAARLAGVSGAAAERGTRTTVSLDGIALADVSAESVFAQVEEPGTEFLELLTPQSRAVLEVRYGLRGDPPQTMAEAARTLRTSPATVCRWERRALSEARRVLGAERTTAVAAAAATAVA